MRFWALSWPGVAMLRRVGWVRLTLALVVLGLLLTGCTRDERQVEPPVSEPDAREPDARDHDDDGDDDAAEDDAGPGDDDAAGDDPVDGSVDPDAPDPAEEPADDGDGPDEDPTAPADAPGSAVAPGPAGIVTIDGQAIAMQEARRCAPMDAQNIERDLELQVIGDGPDGQVRLDIVVEEVGGMPRQALSLTLPDGRVLANDAQDFGAGWEDQRQQALPGPPVEVSGATARVDWVVADPVGGSDELTVVVEVAVPATTTTCR